MNVLLKCIDKACKFADLRQSQPNRFPSSIIYSYKLISC